MRAFFIVLLLWIGFVTGEDVTEWRGHVTNGSWFWGPNWTVWHPNENQKTLIQIFTDHPGGNDTRYIYWYWRDAVTKELEIRFSPDDDHNASEKGVTFHAMNNEKIIFGTLRLVNNSLLPTSLVFNTNVESPLDFHVIAENSYGTKRTVDMKPKIVKNFKVGGDCFINNNQTLFVEGETFVHKDVSMNYAGFEGAKSLNIGHGDNGNLILRNSFFTAKASCKIHGDVTMDDDPRLKYLIRGSSRFSISGSTTVLKTIQIHSGTLHIKPSGTLSHAKEIVVGDRGILLVEGKLFLSGDIINHGSIQGNGSIVTKGHAIHQRSGSTMADSIKIEN